MSGEGAAEWAVSGKAVLQRRHLGKVLKEATVQAVLISGGKGVQAVSDAE